MRPLSSLPRPVLAAVAAVFAAATVLYSCVWIYYIRREPKAQLGFDSIHVAGTRSLRITTVREGSPAQRAGLRPEDRIVAVNSRSLQGPYVEASIRGRPGDAVTLTVERAGASQPVTLHAVLEPRPPRPRLILAEAAAVELIRLFPVLFVVVGLVVLFLRMEDRNAWLLALLFAGFIAGAPLLHMEGRIAPAIRGFALFYKVVFYGLAPALFYYFFAVFPARSPLDLRLPFLKHLLLGIGMAGAVPLSLWVLWEGSSYPLLEAEQRLGGPWGAAYPLAGFGGGLVSLVWNARAADIEARRKTRVIVWGTVAGFTPGFLASIAAGYAGKEIYELPFWVWAPMVLALFLIPLSFAYALLKHRVLDVPVLLRRSARYVLVQRGFVLFTLLLSIGATLVLAASLPRLVAPETQLAAPAGLIVGVGFGILLVWAGTQAERRVASRIDRAFFRSAYDARQIMQDLADQARAATDRPSLAALLERHVREALNPEGLAVYLEAGGRLAAQPGRVPAGLETLPGDLPVLRALERHGQPREVAPSEEGLGDFARLRPECLVPILGRERRLAGLIALGPRLSEGPYSREDKRLLSAVASQAGIGLENILLAEKMAERLEAERWALHEMEIARQVQSKLFPQKAPTLATLEYAGGCTQARAVGGDYYDFLDLGPGRVGLVLADISGKGISAALLMANLQANLRSQYAVALEDLPRLLRSVNHLFFESSDPNRFATLFFGDYDDTARRLRYGNCGHNPPMLLRADGRLERLEPTATVLGLFEEWDCSIAEVCLAPGDTLLIFSDGASEAWSDDGEEFGEARLAEALRANRHLSPPHLRDALVRMVLKFSGREQEDDLTLVVARACGGAALKDPYQS